MKKSFFSSFILLIIFICLLLTNSFAVSFAADSILIYENGTPLVDDIVLFVASHNTYSEKCVGGKCSIGQQFYPVTIHKAKYDSILLTYSEFSSKFPYQGDKYDGSAKDKWSAQLEEKYLQHLEDNGDYFISFDPGQFEGGNGCDGSFCLGGRIGVDRSFTLDIVSGDYEQNYENDLLATNDSVQSMNYNWLFIFSGIILVIIILVFLIKKN